jgi:hypothetical protein
MRYDAASIYALLPAIHRLRDAEQHGPLRALLSVVADELAILEESLAQLHDDQFVETCAPWAVPYLGDLLGVRGLDVSSMQALSARAEVGNTVGYRRRKGTASILEQLAHDVTGWQARAVEYFQLLATTQYLNHLRPENVSFLNVRDADRLSWLGSPFERLPGSVDLTHTVDVRRIGSGRGRYNIPNVGIFLWRLDAQSQTESPAVPAAAADARRFFFSPLAIDTPLFNLPQTEDEFTHLAEPINVPLPIRRRMLALAPDDYYGSERSLLVEIDTGSGFEALEAKDIEACNLEGWVHEPPAGKAVSLDPELGRLSFAANQTAVRVTFNTGFSANVGGGEYDRRGAPPTAAAVLVPADQATVTAALAQLAGGGGEVVVTDAGRYLEAPVVDGSGGNVVLRSANKRRPLLVLGDPTTPGELLVGATVESSVIIEGLLIAGGTVRVPATWNGAPNLLRRLDLRDCALVPGLGFAVDGQLEERDAPSVVVEAPDLELRIDRSIVGALRVVEGASARVAGSIVDATADTGVAYAALDGDGAAGALRVENSTVIGRVHATMLTLASNTIFAARLPDGVDAALWPAAVQVKRRQEGCVRFSHVPLGAIVPRRFHCQPAHAADAARMYPLFESMQYGEPAYCQLAALCAKEIRQGADDESEMGVFHDLMQPQREARLRARLEEFLRFGLEVGVFNAT